MSSNNKDYEHEAVSNFREYLRIPSVHPNVDYSMSILLLLKLLTITIITKHIIYFR